MSRQTARHARPVAGPASKRRPLRIAPASPRIPKAGSLPDFGYHADLYRFSRYGLAMDTELARTFLSVVEAGNFISAADRLHVDRSVLSRRVAALESQLGVQLLHRSTRALSLTEAGAAIVTRARALDELLGDVRRIAGDAQDQPRGLLRIVPDAGARRRDAPFRRHAIHPQPIDEAEPVEHVAFPAAVGQPHEHAPGQARHLPQQAVPPARRALVGVHVAAVGSTRL